jgi:non-lysosomal glucosylceramidase
MNTDRFTYTGSKTNEISFPLGGIGTGCIGLAGNGRLIDWEIFNRPNKGSTNGFSHFAVKAERDGEVLDARVLHGNLHPPYIGNLKANRFSSYGFGPPREYLTGVPHFRDVVFRGEFPIAELTFVDETFPGDVRMTAFNPLIPLNDADSGIPAAFFEIAVTNTTDALITYTLAGALGNPLPENNIHRFAQVDGVSWLHLGTDGLTETDLGYGTLTLATDADDVSYQDYWFRGRWFDNLEVYWHDFTAPGTLADRHYDEAGKDNCGTLAARLTLAPGETARVRFVIAWHFPNRTNDWNKPAAERAVELGIPNIWRNYYATRFADSADSACYSLVQWERLERETRLFKEALFASNLPPAALDAVSANISLLKSPTVMRLEDGTFYGFEGCHPDSGCCEGSCTHVWNYAQALPFLFPALERSMRKADFAHNQRPDGGMAFRLQLPLGIGPSSFRPCADGQFGGVMKVYRDWKICGDTAWLRELWPAVKKSIDFAWSPDNEDRWDPEQTGVLHGRQHHTLDMELFGPNAWLTGFYLGALKAGAEMAEALGEVDTAVAYRAIFARGKAWADANLFNGEYYQQTIDLTDRSLLEPFAVGSASMVGDIFAAYWDEEHGEIKYQIGEGCGIDQVLAQWHANLYGLGEIFDPAQTTSALAAIYNYNFKNPISSYFNPCRIFSLNDEAGLVICDWPVGKTKPIIPVPYSQEAMHGFEYAAAIQMIQMGLVDEGMAVVTAVRDRYDGERRNPWNEIECGSNYARSMASYALLNAFSGFTFDMVHGMIGFDPLIPEDGTFRCFWSLDSGWGTFTVTPEQVRMDVLYGTLNLERLALPFLPLQDILRVTCAGEDTNYVWSDDVFSFASPLHLNPQHGISIQHG